MRNHESSYKARERKLRAKYRRNVRLVAVLFLIIGLAIGAIVGRVTAPDTSVPTFVAPTASPESDFSFADLEEEVEAETETEAEVETEAAEEEDASLTLTLDPTPAAEEAVVVLTAAPTEAPTPEPTAVPEPEVVYVPFGVTQAITAQINSDGTTRKAVGDQTFETLNFDVNVTRYLTPDYYQDNYSTQYQMQGNEAGVEFQLTLKDYMGAQTIMPQELFDVSLENAGGVSEQGFQLTDAEIHGNNKVTLDTNIPKMFYKRFKFSESVGDMTYLSVVAYVDGVSTQYMFELGEPVRPTPTPEPTPVVNYEKLEVGSKSDAVKNLQQKLIDMGYLTGTADGAYGAMTRDAVKAAQAALGMEQTGTATNEFQQKLYSAN